jgi:O-antigen ligase
MKLDFYNINEKICGYAICLAFFSILISTATLNIGIIIAVISGCIVLAKDRKYGEVFIKNKISLSAVILVFLFFISTLYTIASLDEAILSLKKYIKFLYIPICYYILQIDWIRNKAINSFIIGCTIILIFSYLKYYGVIQPLSFAKFANALGADYADKLLGGVTIFQHSIVHGVVLCFYSIITYTRAKNTNNKPYYLLSFLSFYNILFMNISRTSYIITSVLLILIVYSYFKNENYKQNLIIFIFLSVSLIVGNKSTIHERYNNTIQDLTYIQNNTFNTSLGLRYIWAENGIANMILKPIFGHGVGSYKNTIAKYYSKNNLNLEDCCLTQNPHNEFISISTQIGLFGLIVFFTFIYLLIKDFYRTEIGRSVIIIVIISSLFNSLFYDNVMGLFAVLIISLAMQKMNWVKAK